jgi:hypothetical protein
VKVTRYIKTITGAIFALTLIIVIGCGSKRVNISLQNYQPVLTRDYIAYQGKPIYLMNFSNEAENTSIWCYFSEDNEFSYGINDTIQNYFWYALHDTLYKIGMQVSNMDNPNLGAPAMWLNLLSITDEHFRVKVTIQKSGATVFMRTYEVTETPLPMDKNIPTNLENRAYKMTTMLFESILNDPDVMKLFL